MPRGGARPGAGRKPKPKPEGALAAGFTSADGRQKEPAPAGWPFGTKSPSATVLPPAEVSAQLPEVPASAPPIDELPVAAMLRIMRESTDPRIVLQAAVAAAPYLHPKKAPISAKADGGAEKKQSRFAAPSAPRLVSSR